MARPAKIQTIQSSSKNKLPIILETTLRDGSYAINFQFTAADTAIIARELEKVGFRMIEVGHGIGLGASRAGMGQAADTDEAYLRATADAVKEAKWGMFCIPGIAKLEDIDMAAEHGMSFIRIGTNVTEAEAAEPYIARAKKYEMFISTNFMKSYTIEPKTFAQKAKLAQKYGTDVLSIVDSAGGMMTEDMERYFLATQDACDITLAFHGHNNLDLAVANSLKAIELGASIIDTSLQGLGRSAGNTSTEILLLALERKNMHLGINPLEAMDISEKYIRPLVQRRGYDSLDMVAGYAQFHTSYMGIIREYSSKYHIDPRRLIIALCEQDRVNAPKSLVESIAKKISQEKDETFTARFRLDRYYGAEQTKK